MIDLIRKYQKLVSDDRFLRFQQDRITAVYDQLGQGYANKEGEVALVTRMANTLHGQSYGGLRLHCEKIHGSKSYVSFNFRNTKTTKELGDLILISLVSYKKDKLLQKLCIIQNKVFREGKAQIDPEQLFLLKNFPLFSGSQGLFSGAKDVQFRNSQKCLGAYGFFEDPGDYIQVNAGVLNAALGGGKSFSKAELPAVSHELTPPEGYHNNVGFPWIDHPEIREEIFYRWYHKGGPLPFAMATEPLFSSRRTLHDVHDFLKAWTSLQIGEIVHIVNKTIDVEAARFTDAVLRAIGYGEFIDLDDQNVDREFFRSFTVMVSHLDLASD